LGKNGEPIIHSEVNLDFTMKGTKHV